MQIMKTGRHQQATNQRTKATRKTLLGIPIAWWLIASATGVALAMFLILNGVGGSVTVGQADVDYSFTNAGDAVLIDAGLCSASYQTADRIDISWAPLPGETCEVKPAFRAAAGTTRDLVLQSFVAPPSGRGVGPGR